MNRGLICLLFVLLGSTLSAAPQFSGLKKALPAPRAAVLFWDRARGDSRDGSVDYRVYTKKSGQWELLDEVNGTEWVVLDLSPGRDYEFLVRAKDSTGEDPNTRSMTVRPTGAFPSEEWRGVWINRFEWSNGGAARIESTMKQMMQTLAASNMNAAVVQVRGQGDTLYPSPEEPFSPLLGKGARQIDPVKMAIEAARQNGIEFHAWFNLSVIWQSGGKDLPADKDPPFYRMADARQASTARGVIHDGRGDPRQWGADDYVWLTHGNPAVNAYLRRQVVHFLQRYDVDGISLDDRTGMPNGVSRDPVSVERFKGRGNPTGLDNLKDWQLDQLSRFLSDLYVICKTKDPQMLVSAGPFGIADKDRIPGYRTFSDTDKFGVEPEKWLRMGIVDVLMPQIYWGMEDEEPNYGTLVLDWMEHNRSGRPIWPGSTTRSSYDPQPLWPDQARHVAIARALKLGGNQFYSYSGPSSMEWKQAASKIYPNRARTPVPAHMKPGRTGQIMGYVSDGNGKPVVDCWVALSGRDYVYLSSADGFYGIPNVKPGSYTLYFSRKKGETIEREIRVSADKTSNLKVTLP